MTAIIQGLTLAFQFVQQTMSDAAIEEMAQDLAGYPETFVLAALKRCRSELKTIKFSDILDRIPGGHPGVEEAWALVVSALDNEHVTLVWTEQMAQAMGVARTLADEPIAARMAFKEVYLRLVAEARARKELPTWTVSLGYNAAGRSGPVLEAVAQGRIPLPHAQRLIAASADDPGLAVQLATLCPRLLS